MLERFLFNKDLYIVTTNKCSFNCNHCCWDKNNKTLSLSEMKKIFDFAEKYSCNISLGGGEILMLDETYLSELTELIQVSSDIPKITLFSTLHLDLNSTHLSLLNSADRIMFSLDSYRLLNPSYNVNYVVKNALKITNPEKVVSYTPKIDDNRNKYEYFYNLAADSGASCFHIGFLYPSDKVALIPAEKYLEIIDNFMNLSEKNKGPEISFFSKISIKPTEGFGFRAFDCFKSGIFVSPDGIVNSCPVIDKSFKSKYPIPEVKLDQFLNFPYLFYADNLRFMRSCFIKDLNSRCLECDYYTVCMGGCPYFRCFSENNIDIYCEVYKKIFEYNLFLPEKTKVVV